MSEEVKMPLPGSLQEIVGSLLFASETPLTAAELREAVRSVDAEEGENKEVMEVYRTCTSKEIEAALRGLEKALEVAGVGFHLVCTGGAYRLQTAPSCGRYVRALLHLDRPRQIGVFAQHFGVERVGQQKYCRRDPGNGAGQRDPLKAEIEPGQHERGQEHEAA